MVVREFAEAADAAVAAERFGELLEPARSEFGWHLIRVDEVLPERSVDPAAMEAFVEHQLRLEAHMERFSPALREWVEASVIELYPERLERPGAEGY